jgi:hypothetical protein
MGRAASLSLLVRSGSPPDDEMSSEIPKVSLHDVMTINIEARKQRKYDGITEAASAATVRLLLLNSTPLLTSTLLS